MMWWTCCSGGVDPCSHCDEGTTPATIRVLVPDIVARTGFGTDPDPTRSAIIVAALEGDHSLDELDQDPLCTRGKTLPGSYQWDFHGVLLNFTLHVFASFTNLGLSVYVQAREIGNGANLGEIAWRKTLTPTFDCSIERTDLPYDSTTGGVDNPLRYYDSSEQATINYVP